METLVLHPGALGDVILSLPALYHLKRQNLKTRVALAGSLDYLAVVPASCADRTVSLSTLPLQRLYGPLPLPEADLRFWNGFDRIVSWTGFGDPRYVANLSSIHPNALVTKWRPDPGEGRHLSQIFADSLSPWYRAPRGLRPVAICPDSANLEHAMRWLTERGCGEGERIFALHSGSGSLEKRWPVGNFARLGNALLRDRAEKLLLIEGPAEIGLARELATALPDSRSLVAACPRLEHLAALLTRCQAYVGNDSGISHLAAALGIPCAVIFGPTAPELWAPLGPRLVTVRDNDSCVACRQGKAGDHRCLENVSPEAVASALDRMMAGMKSN